MNIDKIHPQLRKSYARIPAIPFHNTLALWLMNLISRIPRKTKPIDRVSIEDLALGSLQVRVYRPEGVLSGAGMLWIHGGGYILGNASTNDRECALYANQLKIIVVSVAYRLAPKYPFPCALDDCFDAWQWFQKNASDMGVSPVRIVISGQSAGGGLAAGLAQRVFDHGEVQPAGQSLFYPMIDDRTAARVELDVIKHRLWNNRNNRGGWSRYLGQALGQSVIPPYAAPARREDLSGLAPAWIGVGDVDLFYEEDALYASRLQAAGVYCELNVVPGAPHGFDMLVPDAPVCGDFIQSHCEFLKRVLEI